MSSRLPTDEALEKEDRIDEMKIKYKNRPSVPHLLQVQHDPDLPYAEVIFVNWARLKADRLIFTQRQGYVYLRNSYLLALGLLLKVLWPSEPIRVMSSMVN